MNNSTKSKLIAVHTYMITITVGEFEFNPGLKYVAKLYISSLWGKFGQNPKQTHKEYMDDMPDVCNKLLFSDKVD